MMREWFAVGCALAALSSGCMVNVDHEPPPAGSLTLLWTVAGTDDPRQCDVYARDPRVGMDLELLVYDAAGGLARQVNADCRSFGTSFWLYPGVYDATATMVDPPTDVALSTSLALDSIRVFEDTETRLDIDFPPGSFLPPPI